MIPTRVIYISMPMTGRSMEERYASVAKANKFIHERFPAACGIINPMAIGAQVMAANPDKSEEELYAEFMAADLKRLIQEATAAVFVGDPRATKSRGMRIELEAARIYDKEIYIIPD